MRNEPITAPAIPPLVSSRFLLFLAATVAWFFSIFVLQAALPQYMEAHGFSNGRIGLVIGTLSISAILPRPYLGRAMDRGALLPLLIASAVMMLSSPLYGIGTLLWTLLGVRLFQGVSSAIFMTGNPALAANLAPEGRRGEAIGLSSVASTVAIATGPPVGLLIGTHLSYHLTFALSAGAGLLCALLLVVLRRGDRLLQSPPRFGEDTMHGSLLEWRVLPAAIPSFVAALGNGVLFAFLVPLMDARHLSGAGFFFTFDALMFFIVRAVGGRWSDRYGRWRVLIPGLTALGVALTVLTAFPVFPAFVVAALIWGGAISLIIPELNALAVDLVPPERRGAALATQTGVFELGFLVSGLALGWVADWLSLPFIFALAAALLFLTAAACWLRYGRNR
ncbi:MAG TPA: MFS transporter [Thermomicrobiales bacterium]|jgi:predicted MFS family arabinose efflux permease